MMRQEHPAGRLARRTVLTLVVVLAVPGVVAAGSGCATAEMSEPVVLPDGSFHGASSLTLCLGRDYSPVASLHETYIDRRPVGLLMSRRGSSEGTASDAPYMMFVRDADGVLNLYGYGVPAADRTVTYLMRDPRRLAALRARRTIGRHEAGTPPVLVAASLN